MDQQPTITPMPPAPPVPTVVPTSKPKSHIFIWIIVGTIILGIGITGGLFLGKKLYPTPQITPAPTPLPAEASAKEGDPTANWKTYTDSQIGYTVKYPLDMIPSRGNCDSFILPISEGERERIRSIRNSGIEIGYEIEGLELAFCVMANPSNQSVKDFAINHTSGINFKKINLNGYIGVKGESELGKFVEYFIKSPDGRLVRIWYRYKISEFGNVANKILSTFKFLNSSLTSGECGVCGPKGLHNVEGAICASGFECKSADTATISYCVKPGESADKCL